ncbi:hsp70 family chaperone [Fusarium pseudoanthophilum]|uniref:Hsp70 family chaperone n=1 Tax=Fusarium pseudoanthophilum TaxID=48495 RepID=A0A8H5V3U6_9HYPO|nr:hsp70 family chaperone [Fusarium pseudoanthophilum]
MYPNSRLPTHFKTKQRGVLAVGIDFGTTNSGVAWATAADFERHNINFISSWPGLGREEGKVPTEIYYDDDGEMKWGYDIPGEVSRLQWFKLLLLKPDDLSPEMRASPFLQRARDITRQSGEAAVDVVADYLRLLWDHAQTKIKQELGNAVFNNLALHIVVTIPAIWKGYAQQSTEQAIRKAGMLERRSAGPTVLNVVTEPEAAALSTILDRYDSVKQGNVYVVCDAGGGTVDLITYEIESIDPIRMREAVLGQGELCGGVFIDEAFERRCRERLGLTWKALSRGGKNEIMKESWEYSIKPQFKTGNPDKVYTVTLPNEMSDIKETFTKVFDDIVELINSQIEKAEEHDLQVTGIILVGGLGGSPYLYSHLQEIFSEVGIDILQPNGMKPRTAICQGAVCKAFTDGGSETGQNNAHKPITVTSTISRAHYGVVYHAKFEEGKHLKKDRYWDEDEGVYRASNQMQWYLKKGDCVSKSERLSHSFYEIHDINWDGRFSDKIYQCEETDPPERLESTVEEVCTMDCTLENCMPVSRLKNHFTPKGKKKKILNYNVRMLPTGRSVNFDVEVNGTRLGKANLNVKFD